MKKTLFITFLSLAIIKFSTAQILCIQYFQQNDSVGVGVGSNNLIINGGFENNNCGINSNNYSFCPNSFHYNCNIANWICTGGGSLSYASFYTYEYHIIQGARAPYFGNWYCNACSGNIVSYNNDTSCLINSGPIVTGIPAGYPISLGSYGLDSGVSLSQTVSGLVSGNAYVLEFWAGGESDGLVGGGNIYPGRGLFAVDIGFGSTFLRNNHTPVQTGPTGTRFLIEFNATSSSHTVKFTNWGHICSNCTELVIDDVRLYTPQFLPPNVTDCSVGTNENYIYGNNLTISPNPFISQTTITFNKEQKNATIKIIDVLGNSIQQSTINNRQSIIDMSAFAKGIYFVRIETEKGIENRKIIKQ